MPRKLDRRKCWNLALANAGMTTSEAARQFGVSKTTVNEVLRRVRVSARVDAQIDAFITRNLPRAMRSAVEAA